MSSSDLPRCAPPQAHTCTHTGGVAGGTKENTQHQCWPLYARTGLTSSCTYTENKGWCYSLVREGLPNMYKAPGPIFSMTETESRHRVEKGHGPMGLRLLSFITSLS